MHKDSKSFVIYCTYFQQKTSDGSLQSEAQSIVHQLCEMYGMPGEGEDKQLLETPLNQQVLPLLRQYWQTHKMLNQCFEVGERIIRNTLQSTSTTVAKAILADSQNARPMF